MCILTTIFLVDISKNQQIIENLWILFYFFVENHAQSGEVSGSKKS